MLLHRKKFDFSNICNDNIDISFKLIKRVADLPRGELIKDLISKEELLELEKNLIN